MTNSIWVKGLRHPAFPPLQSDLECEVCIIGAGIGGITGAYLLSNAGKRVVLVSDGDLTVGETARTTAQINTVHDDGWQQMESIHGTDGIRLAYDSYREALSFIQHTIKREGIECAFEIVDAFLFATAQNDSERQDWVAKEIEAARRAGFAGAQLAFLNDTDLFGGQPAILYPEQGQFNPMLYLHGLLKSLEDKPGTRILHNTHVESVDDDGTKVVVKSSNGFSITADKAIVATNVPIHQRLHPHVSLFPYRSYVVAMTVEQPKMRAQYWDNEDPYHYVRFVPPDRALEKELVLVGGEDHRVAVTQDSGKPFEKLEDWARRNVPGVGKVVERWSAQTIETFDGMALLGQSTADNGNVFIITGDSGTGMTHGTLGAILISEQLRGVEKPWHRIYDPGRPRSKTLKRWLKENAEAAAQYRDWVTPGEVDSVAAIAPGEGAILREGLKKVAVYKDPTGHICRMSAVCPHLGAMVRWNAVEKTWDCPAHGSRFHCTGEVLHGPAPVSLSLEGEVSERERILPTDIIEDRPPGRDEPGVRGH